jgi:hypothetical protein
MKILGPVVLIVASLLAVTGVAEARKKQTETYSCICSCSIDRKTSVLQRDQQKKASVQVGSDCEELNGGGCRYETGRGIYSTGTLGSCKTGG